MSRFIQVVAVGFLVLAALTTGCATAPADAELGTDTVAIPLEQRGADGALYRLHAQFEVETPLGTQVVDASDNAPSITLTLPPGLATIQLVDGWTLRKSIDDGASYTPVSAVLGSFNPAAVRVLANVSQSISFEFLVRSTSGEVTIGFGVVLHPRELAGGIVLGTGTEEYAPYTGGPNFDYAIYYSLASQERVTLTDGSKDVVFTANAVAGDFFNDPIGLLAGTVGPSLSGGFLQYHVTAKPDGTQELRGVLQSGNGPFSELTFGPHTFQFTTLPLDAEGFPVDVFFSDSPVPFTLTTGFAATDGTLTGTLRFRSIPVSN